MVSVVPDRSTETISSDWYSTGESLLRLLHSHWPALVLAGLLGGAVGGAVALLLPSYYQSGAAFQAEATNPTQITGALAGLASQIGNIQLGTQTSSQFFADLLTTDAVLRRVIREEFPWRGHVASLSQIYGYDDEAEGLRDYNTAKRLRRALDVDVNIRTGVVRFTVEARTPELATALAESTLAALNAANIDLRRERAAAERGFTSDRADHARDDLHSAEQSLAEFYQRNRSITSSPYLQLQEGQLRRQVEMAQQVYVQLRLQEEQAAVQEVRNTPAISVIDPPLLPVRRSWPKRRFALLLGAVLGFAVVFMRLAVGNLSSNIRAERKS
jgi:uncharacterized protein involved in exopolysaccharide biosynthesis